MRITYKTIYTAIYEGRLLKMSKKIKKKRKKYNYKNTNREKIIDSYFIKKYFFDT